MSTMLLFKRFQFWSNACTHRIDSWVVGPGPTIRLMAWWPNPWIHFPQIGEGGIWLDLIVIFIPVLGSILVAQTLSLFGVGHTVWMDGVLTVGIVPEHHLQVANEYASLNADSWDQLHSS